MALAVRGVPAGGHRDGGRAVNAKRAPIVYVWDASVGAMLPEPRFAARCAGQFVDGESYVLEEPDFGAGAKRRWFFAELRQAWKNLPEAISSRYPTERHFRCWLMVHTGHCTQSDFALDSAKDAKELAAQIRKRSPYSVIRVEGASVRCWDALEIKGMREDVWRPMSRDVTDMARSMIDVTRDEMRRAAREESFDE